MAQTWRWEPPDPLPWLQKRLQLSQISKGIPTLLSNLTTTQTMSSGVQLNDDALTAFNEFKLGNKKGATNYIIYRLNDDNTEIIVESKGKAAKYEEFIELLPENDCRYAVYDFEFELPNGAGKRNKIVFYQWSPDTAKIKPKMVYASSKEALRRALTGVAADIQGTDFSEVDFETVLERVSRGAIR